MAVDNRRRISNDSSRGSKPARWGEDVCVRRRGAGAEHFEFRRQEENHMIFLLPDWCRASARCDPPASVRPASKIVEPLLYAQLARRLFHNSFERLGCK